MNWSVLYMALIESNSWNTVLSIFVTGSVLYLSVHVFVSLKKSKQLRNESTQNEYNGSYLTNLIIVVMVSQLIRLLFRVITFLWLSLSAGNLDECLKQAQQEMKSQFETYSDCRRYPPNIEYLAIPFCSAIEHMFIITYVITKRISFKK